MALLLLSSCSSSPEVGARGVPGRDLKPLEGVVIPRQVFGMTVQREDVAQALAAASRSYIDATSVYSFRLNAVLQATLQISRLLDAPRYRTTAFRQALVLGLGGSEAVPIRVGRDQIFVTTGTQQRLSVWFRDRYVFILAESDSYNMPRGLLRVALGIQP
jgi:hypothetical protein